MVDILSSVNTGPKIWEKTFKDANDIDEKFSNARDIGYVRHNQYRATVLGSLAKFDEADIYKVSVQSNAKLSLSLRAIEDESKKPLDEKDAPSAEDNLINLTASGMRVEFFSVGKNGKEVLIGDSGAEEGTKLRENMDSLLTGEYKATAGSYYVKLSRDEDTSKNEEVPYVMQLQQGGTPKHDYVSKEQISDDTRAKKNTNIPKIDNSMLSASTSGALISAQGAVSMLGDGYLNTATMYKKSSFFE